MKQHLLCIFPFFSSTVKSNDRVEKKWSGKALQVFLYCNALLFILLNAQSLHAQTNKTNNGVIKGVITTVDGSAGYGITVKLKELNKVTVTSSSGKFEFKNLPYGQYTIAAIMIGHETSFTNVEVTAANPIVNPEITLNYSSQNLDEVIIQTGGNRFAKKESQDVSKMPLKNLENPQVYSIVSKELMKEQIVTDYNSAFKNVPGAGIAEVRNQGRTTSISRGFATPQLVRNGVAGFTYSTIDPANLERIEVIKGPSATLFGSTVSSFGGLFNRVTKKPFDSFRGEVSYSAGSWDLNRLTVDLNTPLNEDKSALLRINTALHSERSFQDAGFSKNYMIAPSFSYAINDRLTLLVDVELSAYKATSPTRLVPFTGTGAKARSIEDLKIPYKLSFANNTINYTSQQYNVFAQLKYKLSDQWNSQTVVSRTRSSSDGYVVGLTGTSDSTLYQTVTDQEYPYYGTDIQQNFNGDFKIGNMRNRIVVGLDFYSLRATRNDGLLDLKTMPLNFRNPGKAYINFTLDKIRPLLVDAKLTNQVNNNENTYSAYVSNVMNVTDQLLVMASLRVDRYNNKGTYTAYDNVTKGNYNQTALFPKFGAVYQVVKDKIAVFGNYMNGFNNVSGSDFNGNTFKPNQANQFEGGIKLDLNKISATVSYYDIQVTNTLRDDLEHNTFQIQDGTQLSKGFEAEFIANPFPGMNIVAGYTYNNSKYTKSAANTLGRRPTTAGSPTTANLWASYRLVNGKAQGLGFGVGGVYGSEYNIINFSTYQFSIPSYLVLDASVFYDRPKFRIGLKADNLTNEKYWSSRLAAQNPTKVTGNITLKF